jgi:hypothetical protein
MFKSFFSIDVFAELCPFRFGIGHSKDRDVTQIVSISISTILGTYCDGLAIIGERNRISKRIANRFPRNMRQIGELPHVCIIPTVEKGKNTLKPSTAAMCVRDDFYRFFKRANDAMAAPPPPR